MNIRTTANLVYDALEMTLWRRNFPTGVIFLSTREASTVPTPTGIGCERISCVKV